MHVNKYYFVYLNIFLILFILNSNQTNVIIPKKIFKISIFYDSTYENVKNLVAFTFNYFEKLYVNSEFQLKYSINELVKDKEYEIFSKLCGQINDGLIAVVAIGDSQLFFNLYSITNQLRIPYITIRWDSVDDPNSLISFASELFKINNESINYLNLLPPSNMLMNAILDFIDFENWNFVTILYHEQLGFSRVEDLIKMNKKVNHKVRYQVKQLDINMSSWDYLLKDLKLSGSSHIIVDLQLKYLSKFFSIAEEVGILTNYFHFFFTSLDFSVFEYTLSTNLTAYQVYEPNSVIVQQLLDDLNQQSIFSTFKYIPSEALFIHDVFLLLYKTIEDNKLSDKLIKSKANCDKEIKWNFGKKFLKYLKLFSENSVSGHIEFDKNFGYRKNITLSLVEKTKTGIDLVWFWRENNASSLNNSIEIVRSYAKAKFQAMDRLKRNLIVSTKLEAPYVMRVVDSMTTTENKTRYRGYCIDLLEKIAKICNFSYTIKLVDDGLHGSYVNGKWNGMVSELIDKKADLVVAALTISNIREQVIDFTNPFLTLGISILYKRPSKPPLDWFRFLAPLSYDVWIYLIGAQFTRFSPYEWQNNRPCAKNSDLLENQWTLSNAIWFTTGYLLRQGTNIEANISPSVRLTSIVWAFFTLLMVSSYTANLAAFLTVQRLQSTIRSVEDLSQQTEVKYGCVKSGSTENFFKESKIEVYARMWSFMSANPQVFVKSTEEGIAKVKDSGYAYLVESTTNDYVKKRDCELMQIGGLLDSKGYGIGTPHGSPWRNIISNAILKLQENGDLQEIYIKWWAKEDIDPEKKCDTNEDDVGSTNELDFEDVSGAFILMGLGVIVSTIIAIFEFFHMAKKTSNDNKSFEKNIINGLKNWIHNIFRNKFQSPFKQNELSQLEKKSDLDEFEQHEYLRDEFVK